MYVYTQGLSVKTRTPTQRNLIGSQKDQRLAASVIAQQDSPATFAPLPSDSRVKKKF
jgi:hypothetical protein